MNAKIRIGEVNIIIVDDAIYVDAAARQLLEFAGLDHKIIGNEACLTEDECRTVVSLFVLRQGGGK